VTLPLPFLFLTNMHGVRFMYRLAVSWRGWRPCAPGSCTRNLLRRLHSLTVAAIAGSQAF